MTLPRPSASACLALILLAVAAGGAFASDTGLSGSEGHPRERFPLAVSARPTGEPTLDDAVRRAVADWNTVATQALGRPVFRWTERPDDAQVTIQVEGQAGKLMGYTEIDVSGGVIAVPVRIVVVPPEARGQTSRETLLYEVVAHELGHALGLAHVGDPRSLMCCIPGSVDFKDPAAREAYIEARRHPDVGSARAQLVEHYRRFGR